MNRQKVTAWLDWLWSWSLSWLYGEQRTTYPHAANDPVTIVVGLAIGAALGAASYALNRLFGPKPKPIERGKLSGDLNIQSATENADIPEIFGAAPSQTNVAIVWENLTKAFINDDGNLENDNTGSDNCFENAGGTGDSGASVVATIASGDFEVSWAFNASGGDAAGRSFIGLTTGSFSLDFTTYRYTIHLSTENNTSGTPHPPNSLFVYEGFPPNLAFLDGVYQAGDRLRIRCVSGVVTYWHKDTLIYTSSTAPSYPLRVCASMACHNSIIEDLVITQPTTDIRGGIKLAGNVIWAKAPRKVVTKEQSGGKGAPKQTTETTTYYTDLAIMFCPGPMRLKKLWANADLILDLDAAIGSPTGAVDAGGGTASDYDQTDVPDPTLGETVLLASGFGARPAKSILGVIAAQLAAGSGAGIRIYEGNFEQLPDSLIQADVDALVGADSTPAYRGWFYIVIENFNISKYGFVPTFRALLESTKYTTMDRIATHLADRVGVEPSDYDFSAFTSQSVRGIVESNNYPPRELLETLGTAYGADFYESVDGQLTGVYFGAASVITIPAEHLGAVEGDGASGGSIPHKIDFKERDPVDLPRQITVSAFNPENDYQVAAQPAYRQTGVFAGSDSIDLPMTLLIDEIRQCSERVLYQRHSEQEAASIRTFPRYGYLDASNVITIESSNVSHRLRLNDIRGAVPGVLEMGAIGDEQSAYTQTIAGGSGEGAAAPTVEVPSTTVIALMDVVLLQDSDDGDGLIYVAASPVSTTGSWQGCVIQRDRGAGYETFQRVTTPATMGRAVDTLATADATVWDYVNTVTVDLYDGELENATETEVLDGANAACLGDEIIQFATATQPDAVTYPTRWTLSNLLRGRRGSEYAVGTHSSGERFVLLDAAVIPVNVPLSERGIARNFKGVTNGQAAADAPVTTLTFDAVTLQPLSPVAAEGVRDMSNDLTLTWIRRSRIGQETPYDSGGDPPLGEQTEAYEIDVIDGVDVVRTITAVTTTASYTAAEATTDGLPPAGPVTFRIYQMSAKVGRGHVGEFSI